MTVQTNGGYLSIFTQLAREQPALVKMGVVSATVGMVGGKFSNNFRLAQLPMLIAD